MILLHKALVLHYQARCAAICCRGCTSCRTSVRFLTWGGNGGALVTLSLTMQTHYMSDDALGSHCTVYALRSDQMP